MSVITITLPDGKQLEFESGVTVLSVAEAIGPGLAKAALAGCIDAQLVDLRRPLTEDAELSLVTARDEAAGEVIRHSAEHVMADAVKRLFPNAQVDAGRTDHSEKFQYDFLVDQPFTPEHIDQIEKEMNSILSEARPFEREVVTREEAALLFRSKGEELKLSRLADIPEDAEITIFQHGDLPTCVEGPTSRTRSRSGPSSFSIPREPISAVTRRVRSYSASTARPSPRRRN